MSMNSFNEITSDRVISFMQNEETTESKIENLNISSPFAKLSNEKRAGIKPTNLISPTESQ